MKFCVVLWGKGNEKYPPIESDMNPAIVLTMEQLPDRLARRLRDCGASDSCQVVVRDGTTSSTLQEKMRKGMHEIDSASKLDTTRACKVLSGEEAGLRKAAGLEPQKNELLFAFSGQANLNSPPPRPTVSVVRVAIPESEWRRANRCAGLAHRALFEVVGDVAGFHILNAPTYRSELPADLHNPYVELKWLTTSFKDCRDETTSVLKEWLPRAGFTVDEKNRAVRPSDPEHSYIIVLTRDAELHRLALEILDGVLRDVPQCRTLDQAPPYPVEQVFKPDVRTSLLTLESDTRPFPFLAKWHVERASITREEVLEQLDDLGVDVDAPANWELVEMLRRSVLLGVRESVIAHIQRLCSEFGGTVHGELLGGDAREATGDAPVAGTGRGGDLDYTLHIWASGSLLKKFKENKGRLEQLKTATNPFVITRCPDEHLMLYHGTTIEAATNIVESGPIVPETAPFSSDFGPAMYLTPSFEYALATAYEMSTGRVGGRGRHLDPAVVCFCMPKDKLRKGLVLTGQDVEWEALTTACLRSSWSQLPRDLRRRIEDCTFIQGPIVGNGRAVTGVTQRPRPMEYEQFAFRNPIPLELVGEDYGSISVVRVLMQEDREWGEVPS